MVVEAYIRKSPKIRIFFRILPIILLALLYIWKQIVVVETSTIELFEYFAFIFIISGYLLRFWANGYRKDFQKRTNTSDIQFISGGPYAYIRHPLYLGNILIVFGVLLTTYTWPVILFGTVAAIVIFYRLAIGEESKFSVYTSSTYDDYKKHTGRFIPGVKKFISPFNPPFSLRCGARDLLKMVLILLIILATDIVVDNEYIRKIYISPMVEAPRNVIPPPESAEHPNGLCFALLGDMRDRPERVQALARQLAEFRKKDELRAIFLLGDNLKGYANYRKKLAEDFTTPMQPVLSLGVPVFAVLGNHDIMYRKQEMNEPVFHMAGFNYYKVTFGNDDVTFFNLDSETLTSLFGDQDQLNWLGTSLENCQSRWKIVLLHRPVVASKVAHGPDKTLKRLLMPIFSGKVDVVFGGHNHFYERMKPVDGTTHITVGGSGMLEHVEFPFDKESVVGYSKDVIFLWFKISGDVLDYKVFNSTGEAIDEGAIIKNPS